MDLDQPAPQVTPRLPVTFGRIDTESLPALANAMGTNRFPEIRARFESGRRCYAAWSGNQLAAYGWVSFEEEYIGELNLHLRLVPGEAYIWDCVTLPAFRQNHLYSALLDYIVKELRAENLCRVWIGADLDNVPSQRGIARAGFQAVADLVIARVSAMRSVWVQGRPGVPEGLLVEARRAFLNSRDTLWSKVVERQDNSGDTAASLP
jgi:hypothetical protein